MRALTPLEARALAVLVEKQSTVPDTYPLSLNSLLAGCNQKTGRDPVINASEGEVLTAVDGLKALNLLFVSSGSRVARYEHNLARGLSVPGQSQALLATLMLRGPQTSAELRANAERLYRFADLSSVEGFLIELTEKQPARVVHLPRAPGEREARWAHLLCGEVQMASSNRAASAAGSDGDGGWGGGGVSLAELAALKSEQARLADELASLRGLVLRMAADLGMDTAPDTAPDTALPSD